MTSYPKFTNFKMKKQNKIPRVTLKKALKKTYVVRTFFSSDKRKHCRIYVPIAFDGKKVKLRIIR